MFPTTSDISVSVFIPSAVVLSAATIATVTDLRTFRIHNALTLPLLAAGLIYQGVTGGWTALLNGVMGMAFGFTVPFMFYLMGGMGGGDVKLMASIGAWLGLTLTVWVFAVSATASGIYAIILIVLYQPAGETILNLKVIWHRFLAAFRHLSSEDDVETGLNRPDRRYRLVPFAPMVTVGLLATLCWLWIHMQQ